MSRITFSFCIGNKIWGLWQPSRSQGHFSALESIFNTVWDKSSVFYVNPIYVLSYSLYCCCLVVKSCLTLLWPHALQPARLLRPRDFPGKNTGIGCHVLLQGVFPTQESNPSLLRWQADSLPLSHHERPYILYMFYYVIYIFVYKVWWSCFHIGTSF